jgi:hypothetical protein
LFVAREDVERRRHDRFDNRFLSIGKPWGDEALLRWKGAREIRYFDAENRRVLSANDAARSVELIPLALYGLDHPKIPALLVDFRKPLNAKSRELSRRAFDEVGARVTTGAGLSNTMIRFGRSAASLMAQRAGMDLLQPSRFLSYAQLKTALSVSPALSEAMRDEISKRVEQVASNPLENDLDTEIELARSQYRALVDYAGQANGLRADLNRDRRAELTTSAHGSGSKFLLRLGGVLTLGLYRHREEERPELNSSLEAQRRALNRRQFLKDVAKSGADLDVRWDAEKVRNALSGAYAEASLPEDELADIAFHIFHRTHDEDTRRVCLVTLHQLDTNAARKKLAILAANTSLDVKWREASVNYLRNPGSGASD